MFSGWASSVYPLVTHTKGHWWQLGSHLANIDIKLIHGRHTPATGPRHLLFPWPAAQSLQIAACHSLNLQYYLNIPSHETFSFYQTRPSSLQCFILLHGTHHFLIYFIFYKFSLLIVHLSPSKTADSVKACSLLRIPACPGQSLHTIGSPHALPTAAQGNARSLHLALLGAEIWERKTTEHFQSFLISQTYWGQ